MNKEKFSTINKENINIMVIEFYMGILFEDNDVTDIFKEKLGEDITTNLWQEHIETLTNFWAMMTLKENLYQGSPIKAHFDLGLSKEMFITWLEMFYETIDSMYEEHLSQLFKDKANTIASNFMKILKL